MTDLDVLWSALVIGLVVGSILRLAAAALLHRQ